MNENETVVFNGIASDPDLNDKFTYLWNQTAGPEVKLLNGNTTNPSFTAPKVASDKELRFLLTAKDDKGASSSPDIVAVLVKHVNRIPRAAAGTDLIVDAGDVTTLDAGKSSDPDNDLLKYSWAQTSGPNVTLSSNDKSIITFTAPTNITTDYYRYEPSVQNNG